jgi:hypothetical protein
MINTISVTLKSQKINQLMKKIILATFLSLVLSSVSAQLTSEQRIQDSVIGWWDDSYFDNKLKPDNTSLQKEKIAIVNKFVEWMKKTYTPVGGLGTSTRYVNKNNYSVLFMVWDVSFEKPWLDAKGHFRPIDEQNTKFRMSANTIPGAYPIPFINTATQYLFTWPPNGYSVNNNPAQETSLFNNSNTGKFLTRVNEWNTVYLAPGNQLPFVAVSKGELLQLAEDALGRQLQAEKEDVQNKWPGNVKAQQDALEYRKKTIEKYRINIQQLREKHKTTLTEPAVLHTMQPTMYSFEINPDPFVISKNEETSKQYFPVYKIEPVVLEKCKTSQPQWVAVSFPYETKEDGNQLYEMYTSLTENFNYDYVYNYFFSPEKVKGKPYKPANEEQLNTRLDGYRKTNNVQKKTPINPLPSDVYFMDDFSDNNIGSKPAGWFFSTSGKHSKVTTLKNTDGKWVELGYNNPLSLSAIKKPLPESFTLEYDLATDGGFSSSTGGAASLLLNTRPSNADGSENIYNNGTRVNINIVSGNEADYENNNYRGNIKIDINSAPSVNTQNFSEGIFYTDALREFTDKKTKVHVTVKVKGPILTVLINDKQVAVSTDFKMTYGGNCISCGLPAGTRFNGVFWKNTSSDAENVKVYISNIKITKD